MNNGEWLEEESDKTVKQLLGFEFNHNPGKNLVLILKEWHLWTFITPFY